VKKADELCARNAGRLSSNPRNAREAEQQTARQIAVRRRLDSELARLSAPDVLRDDLAAYRSATAKAIGQLRLMNAAAKRGQVRRFGQLDEEFQQSLTRRVRIARRLGFEVCGLPQGAGK
jgi:hypothetical protein